MRKEITAARYYNTDGIGVAIVGVANYHNDELFDWAAYIGGSKRGARKTEWAIEDVSRTGNKLSRFDAEHFFPWLPISKYRM